MNLESSFFSEKDSANVFTNMQSALQHQKPIFSLDYGIITMEAAQRFLQQANVMGNTLDISQVMSEEAMETLEFRIATDPRQTLLTESEIPRWKSILTLTQVADLVNGYFGERHDANKTLAESFGKVVFQYCFDEQDYEIHTNMAYTAVIKAYTRNGAVITPDQHRELVRLYEKRITPDSQIRTDYFLAKQVEQKDREDMAVLSPNNAVPFQETWRTCSYRFNKCLNVARDALLKVAKYGNTKTIHSFPGTAALYPLASGKQGLLRSLPPVPEKPKAPPPPAACGREHP